MASSRKNPSDTKVCIVGGGLVSPKKNISMHEKYISVLSTNALFGTRLARWRPATWPRRATTSTCTNTEKVTKRKPNSQTTTFPSIVIFSRHPHPGTRPRAQHQPRHVCPRPLRPLRPPLLLLLFLRRWRALRPGRVRP